MARRKRIRTMESNEECLSQASQQNYRSSEGEITLNSELPSGGVDAVIKGEKLEHETFVFASHANQVFYVNDHLNHGWSIAIGVKPRDLCNVGSDEMLEDAEFEPYHSSLVEDVEESSNRNQSWVRMDVEDAIVDDEGEISRTLQRINSWG